MPNPQINGGNFFTGESLIKLAERIYEEALPPLNNVNVKQPSGADILGYRQFDREVYQHTGRADWINDFGMDAPAANVAVIRDIYNVGFFGASYAWNIREQRSASVTGRPLDTRRGIAARRAIESMHNSLFFTGSVPKQIPGLATNGYIPRLTIDATDWQAGADPDNTLASMYSLEQQVIESSDTTHEPDTLLLATSLYSYAASTRASTLTGETILETYKRNAQSAKTVLRVREFQDAGPAGFPLMMAISTQALFLENIQPDQMTILSPQERSLRTVVNLVAENGGAITEYPLAHCIGELDAAV